MTTEVPPTGRREVRAGVGYLVMTRTFRAPIADVWAAVTEPARMERWIGTWAGDPAEGQVMFRMTAEGEDAPAEPATIDVCDPPRRLVVRTQGGDGSQWQLELDLVEVDGVTTLTFGQVMSDAEAASNIGPGWDYYLDRLVAAETGGDVAALDFDDYYPSQSAHYVAEFS